MLVAPVIMPIVLWQVLLVLAQHMNPLDEVPAPADGSSVRLLS